MQIAVTSQNRKTITPHAGRCRRFWVYQIADGQIRGRSLLELPRAQSFHDSDPHAPHPLDGVRVLIAGSMGNGLRQRLERRGIKALVTTETDPERAVAAFLHGALETVVPEPPAIHLHRDRDAQ